MLERIVQTFEDHKIPHFEWVPRINAVLLEEDGFIDRNLPDAETFWAMLAAVLEQSETHELLRAIKVREDEDAESAFRRTQCEYLKRMGVSYHIRNDGHVIPGVPDEEEPDAVFVHMGDGVGADLASSSTIAEHEFRAAKLPTITEVDEPEPRVRGY